MQSTSTGNRRALLLDALGTLLALQAPAPVLRHELRARFGVRLTLAETEAGLEAEISYYRAHLQDGRDPDSLHALRRRCARVLADALPPSPQLAQAGDAELTDALLASLRFAAFPDARQAVLAARERGERVVVVSNWDVSLPEVLERLELAPLLHGIVTSAQAGARKPSPAIFLAALELAGTGPEQATHVGDSLEEDVAGALAAGVEPVLVRRGGAPGPPGVRTIASLAELAGP
jgi:putative hydrolase of the HAD superfamily